ncbi:hypothetical protein GCM10027589_06750 [Actinocorallia lasiicapitis]
MTAPIDARIAEALAKAQAAQLNLVGLMVAYNVSREELRLLLKWPEPVTAAFNALDGSLRPLAKLLAHRDGNVWAGLGLKELAAYMAAAHTMIMDSPAPNVDHASGVTAIRIDTT